MAQRIQSTKAVLILDHVTGNFQVLNSWHIDDPNAANLSADGATSPRQISGAEFNGTLGTFIAGLLNEAKTVAGI